jgi:hypothetical protein
LEGGVGRGRERDRGGFGALRAGAHRALEAAGLAAAGLVVERVVPWVGLGTRVPALGRRDEGKLLINIDTWLAP